MDWVVYINYLIMWSYLFNNKSNCLNQVFIWDCLFAKDAIVSAKLLITWSYLFPQDRIVCIKHLIISGYLFIWSFLFRTHLAVFYLFATVAVSLKKIYSYSVIMKKIRKIDFSWGNYQLFLKAPNHRMYQSETAAHRSCYWDDNSNAMESVNWCNAISKLYVSWPNYQLLLNKLIQEIEFRFT